MHGQEATAIAISAAFLGGFLSQANTDLGRAIGAVFTGLLTLVALAYLT